MDANIKNLRDALEWLDRDIEGEAEVDGEMSNANAIRIGFIRNMLARFPLRNCDVGTPEEQYARFAAACHAHVDLAGRCLATCPFKPSPADVACDRAECFAIWAQMPYGAKESEVKK